MPIDVGMKSFPKVPYISLLFGPGMGSAGWWASPRAIRCLAVKGIGTGVVRVRTDVQKTNRKEIGIYRGSGIERLEDN